MVESTFTAVLLAVTFQLKGVTTTVLSVSSISMACSDLSAEGDYDELVITRNPGSSQSPLAEGILLSFDNGPPQNPILAGLSCTSAEPSSSRNLRPSGTACPPDTKINSLPNWPLSACEQAPGEALEKFFNFRKIFLDMSE